MFTFPRLQQTPESRPLTDVQRYLAQLVVELNRESQALDERLAAIPILQGKQTPLFVLAAGVAQNIPHGLGRAYVGWFTARVAYPGATGIVQEASGNPDPTLYLRLHCPQAVTLSVWVF